MQVHISLPFYVIAFLKSKADASLAFIANIHLTHKHVLLIVHSFFRKSGGERSFPPMGSTQDTKPLQTIACENRIGKGLRTRSIDGMVHI
jgi:hypothetical protein